MYDSDEDTQLFVINPEDYVIAHGLAIGICDSIESPPAAKAISLVFTDCDEQMHTIMLHPNEPLIQYLVSDEFQFTLKKLIEETVDNETPGW